MVRVGVIHRDGWTREKVPVVAAVESAKPVRYLAAGEGGECAHGHRKAAGSPRHLGRRRGAGVEFVDPNGVVIKCVYNIEESVPARRDSGKVGSGLKGEPGRPGRAAIRRAGNIGAPAQISESHVDAVCASGARVNPVSRDVFLVRATSCPPRVRTHDGVSQCTEALAVVR